MTLRDEIKELAGLEPKLDETEKVIQDLPPESGNKVKEEILYVVRSIIKK